MSGEVFYYISARTEQTSFFPEHVVDQRVVAVYFDKNRRVQRIANYGLQAAALSLGSVILVTGLQVTALLFALPLYARMTGSPVSRWDWTWAAILAAALAVVVTVGNPVAGYSRAPLHTWLVVIAIAGPLVALCLLGARLWPDGAIAAVLLAAISGASLALFAVALPAASCCCGKRLPTAMPRWARASTIRSPAARRLRFCA